MTCLSCGSLTIRIHHAPKVNSIPENLVVTRSLICVYVRDDSCYIDIGIT